MEWIVSGILLLAGIGGTAGGFFFGRASGYEQGAKETPKTNMVIQQVESKTTVNSEQNTQQYTVQVTLNCTFLDGRKAELITVNLKDITNITIDRMNRSNSNYTITNIE